MLYLVYSKHMLRPGTERYEIVTDVPVTNQGVEREQGWLGITNDVYAAALGTYGTLRNAIGAAFEHYAAPLTIGRVAWRWDGEACELPTLIELVPYPAMLGELYGVDLGEGWEELYCHPAAHVLVASDGVNTEYHPAWCEAASLQGLDHEDDREAVAEALRERGWTVESLTWRTTGYLGEPMVCEAYVGMPKGAEGRGWQTPAPCELGLPTPDSVYADCLVSVALHQPESWREWLVVFGALRGDVKKALDAVSAEPA